MVLKKQTTTDILNEEEFRGFFENLCLPEYIYNKVVDFQELIAYWNSADRYKNATEYRNFIKKAYFLNEKNSTRTPKDFEEKIKPLMEAFIKSKNMTDP